jgi:hypothetical protein
VWEIGMSKSWLALPLLLVSLLLPFPGAAATAQLATASDTADLERALDSVDVEQILADVNYVACDDMGGRDTPSVGQRLTARFLRNRLQRLGLKPGAKEGFLFPYPLDFKRVKEADTKAVVTKGEEKLELAFGVDYFLVPNEIEDLDTSGAIVGCGRGTKEEVALAAPKLKGCWALCEDGGRGQQPAEADLRATGAIGLLVLEPSEGRRRYSETLGRWLRSMREGAASWPASRATPLFPRLYLTREAGARLLALAGAKANEAGLELPVRLADARRLEGKGQIECEDVCGFWPGSDPKLAKETILVSAHYDHVGTRDGQVYNGADDNGSGTCGLLALAEALVEQGPLRRSVMLIWVSGEEKGLWGSQAWTSAPWIPGDGRPVADINIDMIGRNAPAQILVTPTRQHAAYNGLTKMVERLAGVEGFTEIKSADAYYHRSDQLNFAKLGIPVVFLFDDVHADYHQPTDDPEKIDGDKIRRVVRLVLRMLNEMQVDEPDLGPKQQQQ